MAEEIELLEGQDNRVEEAAGIDADNAEDVVIDLSLLSSMEEKLVSTYHTKSSPFTICRVPASIRKYDHAAYSPRIVSIGPFHRGRENLQAMEEHKWLCLHEVLAFGRGRNNLEKFLKKMKEIETQARNCYSENIQMSSKEFLEMMVLDGCCIIFLILHEFDSVKFDDLIFGNKWMSCLIYLDMLLLENQLPFFVLECLWELIGQRRNTLGNLALEPFENTFSFKPEPKSPEEDVIHHLLHLVHLSLKPDAPTGKDQTKSASGKLSSLRLCQYMGKTLRFGSSLRLCQHMGKTLRCGSSLRLCQYIGKTLRSLCPTYLIKTIDWFRAPSQQSIPLGVIPSVTELTEAGVRFRLNEEATSFFEVSFEHGLMKMPRLHIYDDTHILFRNFMAFEQCFPKWGNHCTTYFVFIDFLVNTPRDVSILRKPDILRSGLGSNEEVALLFNKLCKEITWSVTGTYLADLFVAVNQHTRKRWPKWRAKLVRDYFGSPWAIISFIAAVIILILTFLQTYFSMP